MNNLKGVCDSVSLPLLTSAKTPDATSPPLSQGGFYSGPPIIGGSIPASGIYGGAHRPARCHHRNSARLAPSVPPPSARPQYPACPRAYLCASLLSLPTPLTACSEALWQRRHPRPRASARRLCTSRGPTVQMRSLLQVTSPSVRAQVQRTYTHTLPLKTPSRAYSFMSITKRGERISSFEHRTGTPQCPSGDACTGVISVGRRMAHTVSRGSGSQKQEISLKKRALLLQASYWSCAAYIRLQS